MRWLTRLQSKSKDPEDRAHALLKLSTEGCARDIQLFAKALLDENADVRRAATKGITMVPVAQSSATPRCIEILRPTLESRDFTLRKSAALALKLLGWGPETAEDHALNHIALGDFQDIACEEGAIEPLLDALKNGSSLIRISAAQALERLQTRIQAPQVLPALLQALRDPEANLRAAAAHALGNFVGDERIPGLLGAFQDSSPLVRAAAAEAVGKSGNSEYLKYFLPLRKDANFEVRLAAIEAMGQMKDPEVLDAILPALRDKDSDVRKCAVETLAKLRDPRAAAPLISTLIDPESIVRHAAANALQIINCQWRISEEAQKAVPFLEAALQDREYWVREAAAKALSRIRNL